MSMDSPPIVKCPVCQEDVELTYASWHRECGDPEAESRWKIRRAEIIDYNLMLMGPKPQDWAESKAGGTWWTRFFGLVLIVKPQRNGPWCGLGFEAGREGESGDNLLLKTFGHPNMAKAQQTLGHLATEYLLEQEEYDHP